VSDLATAVSSEMVSDRFKYDQAAREDVVRIVRAVLRSNQGERQLGRYAPAGG
jgi:hypothetical protein